MSPTLHNPRANHFLGGLLVCACCSRLTTVGSMSMCLSQLLAKAWIVCLVTSVAMLAHEWADTMCFARVSSPPHISTVDTLSATEFPRLWQYKQRGLPVIIRGAVRRNACRCMGGRVNALGVTAIACTLRGRRRMLFVCVHLGS